MAKATSAHDAEVSTVQDLDEPSMGASGPSPALLRRLIAQRRAPARAESDKDGQGKASTDDHGQDKASTDDQWPEHFDSGYVEAAYRSYVLSQHHQPSPQQISALRILDCKLEGVLAHLSWEFVVLNTISQILHPEDVGAGNLSLGTFSVDMPITALPGADPVAYATAVRKVFAHGKGEAWSQRFNSDELTLEYRAYVSCFGKEPNSSQVQALKLLDCELKGMWPQLDWKTMRNEAARRVLHPELMDQGTIGLCGVVASVMGLVDSDPIAYVALVRKIYMQAEFAGKKAGRGLLTHATPTTMPQVDWMVLNVISDTTNEFLPSTGRENHQNADTMVMPGDIGHITKNLGAQETEDMSSIVFGDIDNTKYISNLLAKHGNKVWIIALVDAHYLSIAGASGMPLGMLHWIRILEPARFTADSVTLKFFTWGQTFEHTYTLEMFKKLLIHYHIASRVSGVLDPNSASTGFRELAT